MTDKKGILQPVAYHRLRSLINLKRKIPVSQIPSLPQPLKLKQTQQPQAKEQKEQSMDELTKVKTKYARRLTEKHTERWNTRGFPHDTHHADKSLQLEKAERERLNSLVQ